MRDNYGPYMQMGTLAEYMAACYQTDANLELESHLRHYMEEVEVNISADNFDHTGFMERIHDRLETSLSGSSGPRHQEFLRAVTVALKSRIQRH